MPNVQRTAAPLRTQAAKILRDGIISGRFRPGERLIERVLEEELQVSRTVVREALRQLEGERLIVVRPQAGPVVVTLTYDDVVHLYEARSALESSASRLAATHAQPADIERLRDITEALGRLAVSGFNEVTDVVELKNTFYDALIDTARSPVIGELLQNIQARISVLRSITLGHSGRIVQSHAEIAAVVGAIEAGDPGLAEQRSRTHVQAAQQIALDHIRAAEDQANEGATA